MEPHLTFARTQPTPTDATWLRDRVETLVARKSSVKPFFRTTWMPATARPRDHQHVVHQHALPAYHLPDGSLPFTSGDFGGGLDFYGPDDTRLGPIWRACVAASPSLYNFRLTAGPAAFFDSLTLYFHTYAAACGYQTQLTYWADRPRDLDRWVDQFLRAAQIKKYHQSPPRRPRTAPIRIDHEQGELALLPPDVRWLDQCIDGLRSAGEGPSPVIGDLSCEFAAEPAAYPSLRSQLNAITRRWTSSCELSYRPDFDPFQAPDPARLTEYRFTLATYLGKDRDFTDPTIQLDVVHSRRGSWLELASSRGPATIARYAECADLVDLEIWSGLSEDRWEDGLFP